MRRVAAWTVVALLVALLCGPVSATRMNAPFRFAQSRATQPEAELASEPRDTLNPAQAPVASSTSSSSVVSQSAGAAPVSTGAAPAKVKVDFFVMSHCPDATRCLRHYQPAVKQLAKAGIADVRLNFIASQGPNGQIRCMHGNAECRDNALQMCAQETFGSRVQNAEWFDFAVCMGNGRDGATCAKENSLDFNEISKCAASDMGQAALSRSVNECRRNNVRISCTVNVNDDKFCVQNGGQWEDCRRGYTADALRSFVCAQYTGAKPAECN